jgi:hypothetical protein
MHFAAVAFVYVRVWDSRASPDRRVMGVFNSNLTRENVRVPGVSIDPWIN